MKNGIALLLVWISFPALAQLPVIKAYGGDGRNVNWSEIKRQEDADPDGPGFFYNDCSQGITGKKASSTLAPQGSKSYGISNLNDENPMTAWVEGDSEYGIGEYLLISAININVIYNGYQSSPSNWLNNSRVKRFKVYKNDIPLCYLDLTDEMGSQHFTLPFEADWDKHQTFKFVIIEVYKGAKWKDVAISEMDYQGCCIAEAAVVLPEGDLLDLAEVNVGATIQSVNLDNGKTHEAEVKKLVAVNHVDLVEIVAGGNTILCTKDHPFFFESYGKSSLARLLSITGKASLDELIPVLKILVWDSKVGKAVFVPVDKAKSVEGKYQTFSILELNNGDTYIANGFVSATYKQ